MKRTAIVLALVGIVFLSGGCVSRAFKEVTGGVQQGKGRAFEAQAPSTPLGMYANIEVGTFSNSFGGVTPGDFMGLLPAQITEQLRDKKLPVGGTGKTLVITGDVIYYETAPKTGQLFGPLEEAIANVRLVDKSTGKVVGRACCIGRTNSTSSQGPASKANGLAKAIAGWIAKHSPKKET
jgi:hypothetical protein